MKKNKIIIKIITLTLLSGLTLFANQENKANNDNINNPNVLEYEKILKRLQEKKDYEDQIKLEKEKIIQENSSSKPKEPINFNVIGVIKVQDKHYAYLLTKENKILKANTGMNIDGHNITSITNYGINIENDNQKTFLPIVTNQIQEIDVIFHNSNRNNNINNPM